MKKRLKRVTALFTAGVMILSMFSYRTLADNETPEEQALTDNYWATLEKVEATSDHGVLVLPKYALKHEDSRLADKFSVYTDLGLRFSEFGIYPQFDRMGNIQYDAESGQMLVKNGSPCIWDDDWSLPNETLRELRPDNPVFANGGWSNALGFDVEKDLLNDESLNFKVTGDLSRSTGTGDEFSAGDEVSLNFSASIPWIKNWICAMQVSSGMGGGIENMEKVIENGRITSDGEITYILRLPDGLSAGDNLAADFSGIAGFDFSTTEETADGGKTLIFHVREDDPGEVKLPEYYQRIKAIDTDNLTLNIRGIQVASDAEVGSLQTIEGEVVGIYEDYSRADDVAGQSHLYFAAKQSQGGRDELRDAQTYANKPNLISYTLKVKTPDSQADETKLPADILVKDDTQHTKVYEAEKNAKIPFTGALHVDPIKEQLKGYKQIAEGRGLQADQIKLRDYQFEFKTELSLPEELSFTADPRVSLKGDNGYFKIESDKTEVSDGKITIYMTTAKEVKTFKDLVDAVEGADPVLYATVENAVFNDKANVGEEYTVRGKVEGQLSAIPQVDAAAVPNSPIAGGAAGQGLNSQPIVLNWTGYQWPDGTDSTALMGDQDTDITFTLKMSASKATPSDIDNPSTPSDVNKPSTPSDVNKPSTPSDINHGGHSGGNSGGHSGGGHSSSYTGNGNTATGPAAETAPVTNTSAAAPKPAPVKNAKPATGDENRAIVWMALAGLGGALLLLFNRRKNSDTQ